jgi:hypothetical protein
VDVIDRIIALCSATGPQGWEQAIRRELGGRRWYVSGATGRQQVRDLVAMGLPERTAR